MDKAWLPWHIKETLIELLKSDEEGNDGKSEKCNEKVILGDFSRDKFKIFLEKFLKKNFPGKILKKIGKFLNFFLKFSQIFLENFKKNFIEKFLKKKSSENLKKNL